MFSTNFLIFLNSVPKYQTYLPQLSCKCTLRNRKLTLVKQINTHLKIMRIKVLLLCLATALLLWNSWSKLIILSLKFYQVSDSQMILYKCVITKISNNDMCLVSDWVLFPLIYSWITGLLNPYKTEQWLALSTLLPTSRALVGTTHSAVNQQSSCWHYQPAA